MPQHGVPDIRENWQRKATRTGDSREVIVYDITLRIASEFGDHIHVYRKPKDFEHLYYEMDYHKNPDEYIKNDKPGSVWYDDITCRFMRNTYDGTPKPARGGGIVPDIMIKNTRTKKWVVLEVKRQNAAGNAHERMFRYFGLIPEFQRRSGTKYPFMACVCGPITQHPKYRAEIRASFECFGIGECVHLVQDETTLEKWVRSSLLQEITHEEDDGSL